MLKFLLLSLIVSFSSGLRNDPKYINQVQAWAAENDRTLVEYTCYDQPGYKTAGACETATVKGKIWLKCSSASCKAISGKPPWVRE